SISFARSASPANILPRIGERNADRKERKHTGGGVRKIRLATGPRSYGLSAGVLHFLNLFRAPRSNEPPLRGMCNATVSRLSDPWDGAWAGFAFARNCLFRLRSLRL